MISLNMRLKALSLLGIFSLSLLSACSGTGTSNCEEVVTPDFTLCLSDGWTQVTEEELREEGVPEETIAAFHLTDARGGQRDNIVVTREHLPGEVSALGYSEANMRTIVKTPEYSLIEKREVKVDGEVAMLHIFSARPVADLPVRRFYQLSLTEGSTGYTFTGTLPFSVATEVEEGLTDMLLSVSLKKEATE